MVKKWLSRSIFRGTTWVKVLVADHVNSSLWVIGPEKLLSLCFALYLWEDEADFPCIFIRNICFWGGSLEYEKIGFSKLISECVFVLQRFQLRELIAHTSIWIDFLILETFSQGNILRLFSNVVLFSKFVEKYQTTASATIRSGFLEEKRRYSHQVSFTPSSIKCP